MKLAMEFRKYRPRLVIGLGDKTPMASPDHWQAMQITDAAVFYARLTKWDDQFEHLPPHTIARQLYCHLGQPLSGVPVAAAMCWWTSRRSWSGRWRRSVVSRRSSRRTKEGQLFDRVEWRRRLPGAAGRRRGGGVLISPRPVVTQRPDGRVCSGIVLAAASRGFRRRSSTSSGWRRFGRSGSSFSNCAGRIDHLVTIGRWQTRRSGS